MLKQSSSINYFLGQKSGGGEGGEGGAMGWLGCAKRIRQRRFCSITAACFPMAKRSIIVVVPTLLYFSATQHCNENPIHVRGIPEKELSSLSPNFHIHVSVSYLYIAKMYPHISCSRIGRPILGIYKFIGHSQTHEYGNLDWDRAIPFLRIFVSNIRYCVFAVWETVRLKDFPSRWRM